jgi:hypothetical protein
MIGRCAVATSVLLCAFALAACASLRDQDVKTLRDVQSDLADRYAQADGGDRLVLKTDFCEIDAVLESAGHPADVDASIRCK